MKKKKDDILANFEDKETGFKVPDNYFVDFKANMKKSLPHRDFSDLKEKTMWQHVRPWIYMAAMFGGIWCMMYLFTSLRDNSGTIKPSIAEAFKNESFVDDFIMTNDFNEFDLYQQMYEDSIDFVPHNVSVTTN